MYAKQSDGTISQKFVRQMAKKFEQISVDSTSYISSHEANFKQCNWWLDIPSSVTCFDDLANDSQAQTNEDCDQYEINTENTTHAVETAEVANEYHSAKNMDEIEHRRSKNDPGKAIFYQQIDECLSFPAKITTNEIAQPRYQTEYICRKI